MIEDPALEAVFFAFPNDRRLAALPALARPDRSLAPALASAWTGSALVGYAPEKAATARCLDAGGATLAYAKVYAEREGDGSADIHACVAAGLAGEPGLRVPGVLGWEPARRALALEAMPGRPLAQLRGPALVGGFRAFGRGLARLHGLPAPADRRFSRLEPDRLDRAAALLGAARPDVRAAAERLAETLAERFEPDAPAVLVHGDAHAKNAVVDGETLALIDLDQAAAGAAAADLGGALAGIRYAAHTGALAPLSAAGLARALREGYAEARPLPDAHVLRWYTAAALLVERALRAVSRLRRDGLLHLPAVLDDAWELAR